MQVHRTIETEISNTFTLRLYSTHTVTVWHNEWHMLVRNCVVFLPALDNCAATLCKIWKAEDPSVAMLSSPPRLFCWDAAHSLRR